MHGLLISIVFLPYERNFIKGGLTDSGLGIKTLIGIVQRRYVFFRYNDQFLRASSENKTHIAKETVYVKAEPNKSYTGITVLPASNKA